MSVYTLWLVVTGVCVKSQVVGKQENITKIIYNHKCQTVGESSVCVNYPRANQEIRFENVLSYVKT